MSFVFYAFVYLGFAFADSAWQYWVLLAFYGLQLGLYNGTLLALVADRVDESKRGTAFGFLNLSIGSGLIPANLLAGWLWQGVSPAAAFIAGSSFSCVAFFCFCPKGKSSRDQPPDLLGQLPA